MPVLVAVSELNSIAKACHWIFMDVRPALTYHCVGCRWDVLGIDIYIE